MVQPAMEAPAQPHAAAIKVVSGMFGWDSSGDAVLRGINLEVLQGQLLMVVGECGSGKSSLLSAMMSEMRVWGGNHHVAGESLPAHLASYSLVAMTPFEAL